MKVIGKSTVKITCCATSTDGTLSPIQMPSHDIANANSSISATPVSNAVSPVWIVQPTASPASSRTTRIPPL